MNDKEQESIEINFKKEVEKLKISDELMVIDDVLEDTAIEFMLMVEQVKYSNFSII